MNNELLAQMVSPERLERMEAVLDGRLGGLAALLEDVHKEQNMSACIRTLEAVGIQNVHVIEGDAPFEPNRKITQGCHKWVDIHRHSDPAAAVAALREAGYRILAAAPDAARALEDLDFSTPAVLCFGNELAGISAPLFELADETVRIPMAGFSQSYNLSVSVGICLVAAAQKRRRALGAPSDLSDIERAELRARWLVLLRKGSDEILDALSRQDHGG